MLAGKKILPGFATLAVCCAVLIVAVAVVMFKGPPVEESSRSQLLREIEIGGSITPKSEQQESTRTGAGPGYQQAGRVSSQPATVQAGGKDFQPNKQQIIPADQAVFRATKRIGNSQLQSRGGSSQPIRTDASPGFPARPIFRPGALSAGIGNTRTNGSELTATDSQFNPADQFIGGSNYFVANEKDERPAGNFESNQQVSFSLPVANEGGPSSSTQGTTDYVLAAQPKVGDHYKDETPITDRCAVEVPASVDDFSPDAIAPYQPYDPCWNQQVYENKVLNANQRPLLELGRPWYQLGQLSPGSSLLGFHNNVNPQFLIFGDYRQAIASNTVNGDNVSQMAFELNTFWNLFVTSSERIVWGVTPFDNGAQNTRWEFDNDRFEFEADFDFDFGYLEGDLGAIVGGFTGKTLPFDAPFAIGLTPILIQNGIWLNDAVEGVFFTIPARNSPLLDISNMDISFGFIWDQINSEAFQGDNSAAKAYTIYSFIEALNGYIELDYAFLEDRSLIDRSYHNIGVAYSRRFGNFISHSTRVIANAGQQVSQGDQTADGVLLLLENSLITANPYTVIPYFNMFAGFDTPQGVAGDTELLNTGILFESDGMTGYPTLDGRARDTAGGAVGLNLLAQDFSQQLILEAAAVFKQDDSDLAGDQYGIGMRYQLPLSNSWIFRTDSMYGFLRNDSDDFGMRFEMRKKF